MATRIHHEDLISNLLADMPQLRPVFDRYGLRGCGGQHGPPESIRFFAKTHGVDEAKLLRELEQAAASGGSVPEEKAQWVDGAYKWFFGAGVAIALLGGAVLGTWFMYTMGSTGSYFAPGVHRMNAHAFLMIYGFVGAFVMGFGYQALPRFKQTVVRDPGLVALSLVLLLAGVGMRFFGEFFGHGEAGNVLVNHVLGGGVAIAGTSLTFAAFVVFTVELLRTYRSSGKALEAYDWWILGSLFWFNVSLLMSGAYYVLLLNADGFSDMVMRVAVFQDALRNVQLFGAVTLIVFGVMLRFLPPVLGFRAPDKRRYMRMFWLVNAGLVLMVVAFPLSMATKRGVIDAQEATTALRGVYFLGAIAMSVGLLAALAGFRPWARPSSTDRSVKFARASHLWLAVALLMLLLEPLYVIGILKTFGHGYHGGMRHALTLGFLVMMIVAVSTKVVPTLNGFDTAKLSRLRTLFVLLNLAIAARLVGEIAGDFTQKALPVLAPTGVLLMVALLIWGVHLARIVHGRAAGDEPQSDEITARSKVGLIVERWPQTLNVFMNHGFALLANLVARRTIARRVSLEQVCRMHNKDLEALMADLKKAAAPSPQLDPELTVAEVAERYPTTVPVFAEMKMDTCCGGADSIRKAATHHGHELADVLSKLQKVIPA